MESFDCTQALEFENIDEHFRSIQKPSLFKKPSEKIAFLIPTLKDTRAYPLYQGENVVGRSMSCGVRIENKILSKKHAVIDIDKGHCFVQDQNSLNGTYKGKVRLKPMIMYNVEMGEVLVFGNIGFKLSIHEEDEEELENSPAISPTQVCSDPRFIDSENENRETELKCPPESTPKTVSLSESNQDTINTTEKSKPTGSVSLSLINNNCQAESNLAEATTTTGCRNKEKRVADLSSDDDETDSEIEGIMSCKTLPNKAGTHDDDDNETASEGEFEDKKVVAEKIDNHLAGSTDFKNSSELKTFVMETQDILQEELEEFEPADESLLEGAEDTAAAPVENAKCEKCNRDLSTEHICLEADSDGSETENNTETEEDAFLLQPTQPYLYSNSKSDNSETQRDSFLFAPTQKFVSEPKKIDIKNGPSGLASTSNKEAEDNMFVKPLSLPHQNTKGHLPSSGESVDPNAFTQPCLSLDDFEEVDDFDCETQNENRKSKNPEESTDDALLFAETQLLMATKNKDSNNIPGSEFLMAETQPMHLRKMNKVKNDNESLFFAETQPLVGRKLKTVKNSKNKPERELFMAETQLMSLTKKNKVANDSEAFLLAETQPLVKRGTRIPKACDDAQETDLLLAETLPQFTKQKGEKTENEDFLFAETQPLVKRKSETSGATAKTKKGGKRVAPADDSDENESDTEANKALLMAETQPFLSRTRKGGKRVVPADDSDENNSDSEVNNAPLMAETQPLLSRTKKGGKRVVPADNSEENTSDTEANKALLMAETQPFLSRTRKGGKRVVPADDSEENESDTEANKALLMAETQPFLSRTKKGGKRVVPADDSDESKSDVEVNKALLMAETQPFLSRTRKGGNRVVPADDSYENESDTEVNKALLMAETQPSSSATVIQFDSESDEDCMSTEMEPFKTNTSSAKFKRGKNEITQSHNESTSKGLLQFEESFVGNISRGSDILCMDSQPNSKEETTPKFRKRGHSFDVSSLAETPSDISFSPGNKRQVSIHSFEDRLSVQSNRHPENINPTSTPSNVTEPSLTLSCSETESLASTLKNTDTITTETDCSVDSNKATSNSRLNCKSDQFSSTIVNNVVSCNAEDKLHTGAEAVMTEKSSSTEIEKHTHDIRKNSKKSKLSKKKSDVIGSTSNCKSSSSSDSAKPVNIEKSRDLPKSKYKNPGFPSDQYKTSGSADDFINLDSEDKKGTSAPDRTSEPNPQTDPHTSSTNNGRKGKQKSKVSTTKVQEIPRASENTSESKPRVSSRSRRPPAKLRDVSDSSDSNQNSTSVGRLSPETVAGSTSLEPTVSLDQKSKKQTKGSKSKKNVNATENPSKGEENEDRGSSLPDISTTLCTNQKFQDSLNTDSNSSCSANKIISDKKSDTEIHKRGLKNMASNIQQIMSSISASIEKPISDKTLQEKNRSIDDFKLRNVNSVKEPHLKKSEDVRNSATITDKNEVLNDKPIKGTKGRRKAASANTVTKTVLSVCSADSSSMLSSENQPDSSSPNDLEKRTEETSHAKSRTRTKSALKPERSAKKRQNAVNTNNQVADMPIDSVKQKGNLLSSKNNQRQSRSRNTASSSESRSPVDEMKSSDNNVRNDMPESELIKNKQNTDENDAASKRKGRYTPAKQSTPRPQDSANKLNPSSNTPVKLTDNCSTSAAEESNEEAPPKRGRPRKGISKSNITKIQEIDKLENNNTTVEKNMSSAQSEPNKEDTGLPNSKSTKTKRKLEKTGDSEEAQTEATPTGERRGRARKETKLLETSVSDASPDTFKVPGPVGKKRLSSTDSNESPLKKRNQRTGGNSSAGKLSNTSSDSSIHSNERPSKAAMKPYSVLFTGVSDPEAEEVITRLGGTVVTDLKDCSLLCTDKFRRTVKFLCCVGKGLPIVSMDWISACQKEGQFVDPKQYILRDKDAEKTHSFQLDKTLKRASEAPLFGNWSMFVTASVVPGPEQMREIIECSGGKFLTKSPHRFMDQILIVSSEADKKVAARFLKMGFPIVTNEFILTGLVRQEICLKKFSLPL